MNYISFGKSPDVDEANGLDRAYLCAFRIHPEYQGKGAGSTLLNYSIRSIIHRGFTEATIGVEPSERHLVKIYSKFGFKFFIKTKDIDHHGINSDKTFKKVKPYDVYLSRLLEEAADII